MINYILSLWYKYKNWRYKKKCIKYFGCEPEVTYISEEAYNKFVKLLNQPTNPEVIEKIKNALKDRKQLK